MELKDRMAMIIEENGFKQIELAELMGVSGSYISTLLAGRNKNVSTAVASLIEEKLGYSARWVLSGEEPKFKPAPQIDELSDVKNKVAFRLEKMTDEKAGAVLAFIESLDKVGAALGVSPAPVKRDVGKLFATFVERDSLSDDEFARLLKLLNAEKDKLQ